MALLVLPGPKIKSHPPTKTSGCWISCQALTPPPPVCWWNVPWKGPSTNSTNVCRYVDIYIYDIFVVLSLFILQKNELKPPTTLPMISKKMRSLNVWYTPTSLRLRMSKMLAELASRTKVKKTNITHYSVQNPVANGSLLISEQRDLNHPTWNDPNGSQMVDCSQSVLWTGPNFGKHPKGP